MNESCGCCEGLESLTPLSTANRPGLEALSYRIGTHATFLETMKTRLSSLSIEKGEGEEKQKNYPLSELKTRDSSDPAIAILDAWATIADVLTFYQERIANEGYLRTATERRSIQELSSLVGYSLRPGVAATAYPAFMMETGYNQGAEVPQGTKIQSLPAPGEMPQFFETSEPIAARADWNELKPRLTQPQVIKEDTDKIYFKGISTNLKPGDRLLLVSGDEQILGTVKSVKPQAINDRTLVKLQESPNSQMTEAISRIIINKNKSPFERLASSKFIDDGSSDIIDSLLKPPSIPPANSKLLSRKSGDIYGQESDIAPKFLTTLKPVLKNTLYPAWSDAVKNTELPINEVHVFRTKAAPFGHNAPLKAVVYGGREKRIEYEEWQISNPLNQPGPQANFSSSPTNLTVRFTDQSTGNISNRIWNFGDDNYSTETSPTHTFSSANTYLVTLIVSGANGYSVSQQQVTVTSPPSGPR
jgi:PKD domain